MTEPLLTLQRAGAQVVARMLWDEFALALEAAGATAERALALVCDAAHARVAGTPEAVSYLIAAYERALERWRRPHLEGTTRVLWPGQAETLTWVQPVDALFTGLEFESATGLEGWTVTQLTFKHLAMFMAPVPAIFLTRYELGVRQFMARQAEVTLRLQRDAAPGGRLTARVYYRPMPEPEPQPQSPRRPKLSAV